MYLDLWPSFWGHKCQFWTSFAWANQNRAFVRLKHTFVGSQVQLDRADIISRQRLPNIMMCLLRYFCLSLSHLTTDFLSINHRMCCLPTSLHDSIDGSSSCCDMSNSVDEETALYQQEIKSVASNPKIAEFKRCVRLGRWVALCFVSPDRTFHFKE